LRLLVSATATTFNLIENDYKPLQGGKTKNEHFLEMLTSANERGFAPSMVCFDGWYSSLENLKTVRSVGWDFLTRLKHNRRSHACVT
jgi:hypothetical protein